MLPDQSFQARWCEAIIASSEDAIISKTLDGIVTSWNAKAQQLFGYSPEEIIGQPVTLLFPPERKDEERQILHRIQRGDTIGHFDTVRLHRDGSRIDVSLCISPIRDEAGKIVGISKIIRDISERKRTEVQIARLSAERLALLDARTAELHLTEEILEQRTRELRATLRQLADAERRRSELERKRLSQDLHDEIGQMLTALSFNLEMARRKVQAGEALAPLTTAIGITEDIVRSVRRIVYQLRPPQLDDFGLVSALRWHLDHLGHSALVGLDFEENLGPARLHPDLEMTCFRIVQESITNILRHASANQVHIRLQRDGERLDLSIRDNGVGFAPPAAGDPFPTGHFGLRGMRERVLGLNGHFTLVSAPGQGCAIAISLPLAVAGGPTP